MDFRLLLFCAMRNNDGKCVFVSQAIEMADNPIDSLKSISFHLQSYTLQSISPTTQFCARVEARGFKIVI